ncbi:MAG: ATP-binding protein, partial [Campylobacterales bacterium]|nr:ATP-binding protein [Campylobacterales bacterium]
MPSLLVIYNPYYQKDVIDQHLRILRSSQEPDSAKVAFGKILSKLRDKKHPFDNELQEIFSAVSSTEPIQLFITDFSSLYVGKVVEITQEDCFDIAPEYYQEHEIEYW